MEPLVPAACRDWPAAVPSVVVLACCGIRCCSWRAFALLSKPGTWMAESAQRCNCGPGVDRLVFLRALSQRRFAGRRAGQASVGMARCGSHHIYRREGCLQCTKTTSIIPRRPGETASQPASPFAPSFSSLSSESFRYNTAGACSCVIQRRSGPSIGQSKRQHASAFSKQCHECDQNREYKTALCFDSVNQAFG